MRCNTWIADYDSMRVTLENINWANIMNSMNTLYAFSYYRAILKETTDIFVLLSRSSNEKSTYMTIEAFRFIKLKSKLCNRHRYHLSKADCNYSTIKDASNRLRSLTMQESKMSADTNQVSDIANNPKRVWCYVNSSLKARPNIDALQCIDGSLASSNQEKADLLNSYFSSVFTHENLSKELRSLH